MNSPFTNSDPHKRAKVIAFGQPLDKAARVIITIHGRGATAQSMKALCDELELNDTAFLAPQANDFAWYPYSFMAPVEQNQPYLNSALSLLEDLEKRVNEQGFSYEQICWMGFSQGACLISEYSSRNAKRYGGIFVLSGGVIGETIDSSNYSGDFNQTPVFIGCSDVDAHIPVERVHETGTVLQNLGANVDKRIYPGMGHHVNEDEIVAMKEMLEAESRSDR